MIGAAVVIIAATSWSGAAEPATQPSAHPLLDALNRETQDLSHNLQGSVLRVQMPTPRWVIDLANRDRDNRFDKYNLDPAVRQQLNEQGQRRGKPTANNFINNSSSNTTSNPNELSITLNANGYSNFNPSNAAIAQLPTTQPFNSGNTVIANGSFNAAAQQAQQQQPIQQQATPQQAVQQPQAQQQPQQQAQQAQSAGENGNGVMIVVPPVNSGDQQQELIIGNRVGTNVRQLAAPVVPNNIGIVLDDQGHVLVPLYLERESADRPVRLIGPDGEAIDATYVGADQQTNVTVLQLPHGSARTPGRGFSLKGGGPKEETARAGGAGAATAVKPVKLSKAKPREGELVLYLSTTDGASRLGIWTSNTRDYGVVVSVDGQVLGIARYGQFLSGSACQLIADQIIRHGAVKRATLGVIISQIEKDDPLRQQQPLLGERPAVRVDQVMNGSPAEQGGLRQGDVILALAGEAVNDIPSLAAAVAARNNKTQLQVLRGDQVLDVTVDLEQK